MHAAVRDWVARWASEEPLRILDIGGRDINGSCRDLFPRAAWTSVDLRRGKGVDIVADVTVWEPPYEFDLVLCTEVFEHVPNWPEFVGAAGQALCPGGRFICTCAGPGRAPHSAIDGAELRPGEHYRNLDLTDLEAVLIPPEWHDVEIDESGPDLRATATKGR